MPLLRLLDHISDLFVFAVSALGTGDDLAARTYLKTIRRNEGRWQYGNCHAYRITLAVCAIVNGIVGYVVIREGLLILAGRPDIGFAGLFREIAQEPPLPVMGLLASSWALMSYFGSWTSPNKLRDFGDRLTKMLAAGSSIQENDAGWPG